MALARKVDAQACEDAVEGQGIDQDCSSHVQWAMTTDICISQTVPPLRHGPPPQGLRRRFMGHPVRYQWSQGPMRYARRHAGHDGMRYRDAV